MITAFETWASIRYFFSIFNEPAFLKSDLISRSVCYLFLHFQGCLPTSSLSGHFWPLQTLEFWLPNKRIRELHNRGYICVSASKGFLQTIISLALCLFRNSPSRNWKILIFDLMELWLNVPSDTFPFWKIY